MRAYINYNAVLMLQTVCLWLIRERCCCVIWQGKSLKQELQRQQRALAAAEEREATLQKHLADRDAVKDEGQVGKHVSFLLGRVVFERTRKACSSHAAVVLAENAHYSHCRVLWRHFCLPACSEKLVYISYCMSAISTTPAILLFPPTCHRCLAYDVTPPAR